MLALAPTLALGSADAAPPEQVRSTETTKPAALRAIRLHAASGADHDVSTGGAYTSLISRKLETQWGLDGRTSWSMLVRVRFTNIVDARNDWWRFPDDQQFAMDLDADGNHYDLVFETKSTMYPLNGYDTVAVNNLVEGKWYTLVANTNLGSSDDGETEAGRFEILAPGATHPMAQEPTQDPAIEAVSPAKLFGNIRPNENTFDVDIAEIAIFDRCLTQHEVNELGRYTADASPAASSMLAHWIFNAEGASSTPANGDVNLSERMGEIHGFFDLALGQTPNVGLHTYVDDGPALRGRIEAACPADLNEDDAVDGADLGLLLGAWGGSEFDLNADGATDGADLGLLLGAWGACP